MKYIMSLFLGIIALVLLSLHFIYKTVPSTQGELSLKGLSSKVSVYRDQHGVPHIEANNLQDAYFSLGFIQSSDRLFQMELLRRIGSGTLSEVLGEDLLKTDILLRSLKLKKTAAQIIKNNQELWPIELKEQTSAFLKGVNTYVKTMPLPIEFTLLGIKPEPFTLADIIAVSGYMSLSFAEALLVDPLQTDLQNELSADKINDLFINHKYHQSKISDSTNINADFYKNIREALTSLEQNFGLFHGSNSWVLSGKKTKSGKPMLGNDPHVAFSIPGIWYEAHLKTPENELYGYYIPLSPYPPMANNKDVAWAVTMAEVDDLDLFEEKIVDDKVMHKNIWIPLLIENEVIKVKNKSDFSFKLLSSPHGPLIDQTSMGLKDKRLAIKWSYHHPQNDTLLALYKLSKAKNLNEFHKAISHGGAPALNMSWADSKGNIAWKIMSKIPKRIKGINSKRILEGWHGKHDYLGYLTAEENPGLINPKEGYIASANYAPLYSGPYEIPGYYQASERYGRISDLLKSKESWTPKSMMELQTDEFVNTSSWMIPNMTSHLKVFNDNQKEALNYLNKWKGGSDQESIASTLYHLWTLYIIKNIYEDELGTQRFLNYTRTAEAWSSYKALLKKPTSALWDNITTTSKESAQDILQLSFEQTINHLETKFGSQLDKWSWGKLHTLEYPHAFGKKKPLNLIFNRGPYPVGGGFFQINNMSSTRSDLNFNVSLGPSLRRIVDFNSPLDGHSILPSGNSGNPVSEFYDDQIKTFLNNDYRSASLNWVWIKENSTKLILTPQ